jgi:hypothetical protein
MAACFMQYPQLLEWVVGQRDSRASCDITEALAEWSFLLFWTTAGARRRCDVGHARPACES